MELSSEAIVFKIYDLICLYDYWINKRFEPAEI